MIFDARHKPIPLPEIPRLSRTDADVMFAAGITFPEWQALPDDEKAKLRWNTKMGSTAWTSA